MAQLFSNFAAATLASGIDNSTTTLTLQSGKGALFPNPSSPDYFLLTLTQAGAAEISWEVVKVTARSSDTLTVVRGQEGTTAAAWSAGDKAELRLTGGGLTGFVQNGATAINELKGSIPASDIDLSKGNYFAKTISGTTTFTVSNVPSSGTVASFILELTNGGSATTNLWSGIKWASGTAPSFTAAGVDILGFYTHDGGTTWRGLVLAKDSK